MNNYIKANNVYQILFDFDDSFDNSNKESNFKVKTFFLLTLIFIPKIMAVITLERRNFPFVMTLDLSPLVE